MDDFYGPHDGCEMPVDYLDADEGCGQWDEEAYSVTLAEWMNELAKNAGGRRK